MLIRKNRKINNNLLEFSTSKGVQRIFNSGNKKVTFFITLQASLVGIKLCPFNFKITVKEIAVFFLDIHYKNQR